MSAYRVLLSDDARADIDSLTTVILFEYQAPLTAFRYIQGLLDTILSLEKSAESFPLQTHPSLLKYGQLCPTRQLQANGYFLHCSRFNRLHPPGLGGIAYQRIIIRPSLTVSPSNISNNVLAAIAGAVSD